MIASSRDYPLTQKLCRKEVLPIKKRSITLNHLFMRASSVCPIKPPSSSYLAWWIMSVISIFFIVCWYNLVAIREFGNFLQNFVICICFISKLYFKNLLNSFSFFNTLSVSGFKDEISISLSI